jgi:hypothetical protein
MHNQNIQEHLDKIGDEATRIRAVYSRRDASGKSALYAWDRQE